MAAVGLLWLALALLLAGGLFTLVWVTLTQAVIAPGAGADLWEFRFRLAQMLALTTVLGAVVALPITLTRLRLSREEAETAKEALFNQKITEAAADLYAQRQVTRRYADGRLRDEWEDDIVRRNAAIDRLEWLIHKERPEEAERVARLLSTYVRELSREHPPKPVPDTENVKELAQWAHGLRPARSDMENAAQVLGRLAQVNDFQAVRRAIDLRGANLQGFDLQGALLNDARLDGAHLQGARMDAAQLRRASINGSRLQGARLMAAQLSRALLERAQLHGASLGGADIWGGYLREATLRGAYLSGAQFQAAYISGAQFQGTDLGGARMDKATVSSAPNMKGASIREVDTLTIMCLKPHWNEIFADGSVSVPEAERPAHWPSEVLGGRDFHEAWRAWQHSIGMDPDDPE